jgi:hypothetical protein
MTGNQNKRHTLRRRNNKNTKEILNICRNHTYLTKIEEKIIWRGDSIPKLTINHPSPLNQEEVRNCDD